VELILGTAQLTRRYGVTRSRGRGPDADDARALLQAAWQLGVRTLDTAPVYGSAEERIGADGAGFAVHTKLDPALAPADSLRASLARLQRDRVEVLHLHDPAAVTEPSGAVLAAAAELVGASVGVLGASVYTVEEFDAALADPRIGVVQVPISVLDRRIGDERLLRAKDSGTRVLARSILLQGLLADPIANLGRVPALDAPLRAFAEAAGRLGRDADLLAVGWVRARPGVEGVVVGVEDPTQLRRLAAHLEGPMLDGEELDVLARLEPPDAAAVDPRSWAVRP